jgi:signal peptidase I
MATDSIRSVETTIKGAMQSAHCRAATADVVPIGPIRHVVELIVSLCLCLLVARTFCAEAYVVPTGSMAPTLLGLHHALTCRACGFLYMVGADEGTRAPSPVCPNCGERAPDDDFALASGGDRVIVQKFVYDFRHPRRWEVAVFHFPGEPSQAYVKRVVGLPGETIAIKEGDVYVDGRIARKSLGELRAMQILVHDSRFEPADPQRPPRWAFHHGDERPDASATSWKREGDRFVHSGGDVPNLTGNDWLVYKHWEPSLGQYGPIKDFCGYNGGELRADNDVRDVAVEATLVAGDSVESIAISLVSGGDRFVVTIPVATAGAVTLDRNGRPVPIARAGNPFDGRRAWPRTVALHAAVCDRRVQFAADGELLFEPVDYDDPVLDGAPSESPVALGVRGNALEVANLRIFRDVYYTSTLASTPRHAKGRLVAVNLGPEEYFVLGDNSPVSNDSRFWGEGPVVRGSMFVGKPLLVHLPGQVVPLEVFGRSVCWVPDPRRIRYIR